MAGHSHNKDVSVARQRCLVKLIPRLITSSLVTVMTIACVCAPDISVAKEFYLYQERDGTKWITDHWLPPSKYAYIGKYGRPTAVLSCRGLKSGELDLRAAGYEEIIDRYANAFGVDPLLVKSVMRIESCFDHKAVSRVGAQGLMQLMPFTARDLGVLDSFDPDQNIRGGTQYLGQMLKQFSNNETLALAAYNAGPGAVAKHNGVPPYRETLAYVKKVGAQYDAYKASAKTNIEKSQANIEEQKPQQGLFTIPFPGQPDGQLAGQ